MKTLLLLEDETDLRKLLVYVLGNYMVLEAASAEQALRLFIEHRHRIDLLVAEVILPASSGVQVALLLRLEKPSLPVILTSGYPVSNSSYWHSADLERLGSNAIVILQKPFRALALLNAIAQLIGEPSSEIARA